MHRTIASLAAAALLAPPLAGGAQALDLPARKAGLWEMTTSVEQRKGRQTMTSTMCIDAASDRELMDYGLQLASGKCKGAGIRRDGKSYVFESDCPIAGKPTKTKTVITGDFQSAYTMHTELTVDRGNGRSRTTATTATLTWKSADCPGMKPGDIVVAGGVKVNVKQLKALSGLIR